MPSEKETTPSASVGAPSRPGVLANHMSPLGWSVLAEDAHAETMLCDPSGRVQSVSVGMARRLGAATPEEIINRTIRDLLPPEMAEEHQSFLVRASDSDEPVRVRTVLRGARCVLTYRRVPTETPVVLVTFRAAPGKVNGDAGVIHGDHGDHGLLTKLTARELDVLELIGEGMSTAQIANTLHRSVKTIEWHRVSLGNKLGVSNRVELARIAIGAGLCNPPSAYHPPVAPQQSNGDR